MQAEYGPRLKISKRYPWEAFREQVWFVNFLNVAYLWAQRIAGFENPTPFARVTRNSLDPRYVLYLFPAETQNVTLKSPMQPYVLHGCVIDNPCLTQRYHRVDSYFCFGGGEDYAYDPFVGKRTYDVFGFCLYAHNPYGNYYYPDYAPSPLIYPPGLLGYEDCDDLKLPRSAYYYFEESQTPALQRPVTTFYRWYQFSVFYLVFSISFILFLLFLRVGLDISISNLTFGLPAQLLSFTAASYT